MKRLASARLMLIIALLATLVSSSLGAAAPTGATPVATAEPPAPSAAWPAPARVEAALDSGPVMFIENVGQFDPCARFQVRGGERTIWLTEDGIWVTVLEQLHEEIRGQGNREMITLSPPHLVSSSPQRGVNLKLSFPGANPRPRLEPLERLETSLNYFIGSDPAAWRTDVPVYAGVRYLDLYPGVDLVVGAGLAPAPGRPQGSPLPWRLEVRDGADLSAIRLRVEGAEAVELLPSPDAGEGQGVRVATALGDFSLPLLAVEGATPEGQPVTFNLKPGTFEVSFPFSAAPHLPLSLSSPEAAGDPAISQDNPDDLLYATFLGGSDWDGGYDIAVDGSGAAYVTGWTYSTDFPATPGAFDTTYSGSGDAFVAKLNPAGSALAYATFLGGSSEDEGYAIAVDGSGATYIVGRTYSSGFPTTPGAFDRTHNGGSDAFVVKLNVTGTALAYATFLGGSGNDYGEAIAVDGSGAAYVTGWTYSTDFPVTPGAFDTTYNGYDDAFVAKLAPAGSALAYATFLGGSSYELGTGIAVDGGGAAYVTGYTNSPDFPATPGAFDTTHNGYWDAFVAKLNPAGSTLAYATFLGGGGNDYGEAIAVDGSGAAYVTGWTYSTDFPATAGAFDTTHNGAGGYPDAFVAKLAPAGSALAYATFLGGSGVDWSCAVAVDGGGAAYVTGVACSSDFPATPGAFDTSCGTDGDCNYDGSATYGDGFVAKLNPAGSALAYATFLGGSGNDYGYGIAVDADGAAYVTGDTYSADFPATPGAFDATHNGSYDAFVAKLAMGGGAPTPLAEKVQHLATQTNGSLDQVLVEANRIALDGDYFAIQKTEHEIELIAEAVIDSAGILADGFDAVDKARDLTKMEFPGVVGRGWGHILDLKASHEPARNAFRDALQQELTGANAVRTAQEFFNGAHIYYAADMLDAAAEDLLTDGAVKYGLKVGLQSDLALQSQLYPAQQTLGDIYKQDVADTRDETIAGMPALTPQEEQAYIEDLTQREKANIVLAFALERRALPLHLARSDRESGQGNWIANFLAKYLIKGLAFLYADGPGVLAVDVGSAFWDLYQNSRQLQEDAQMMNLAVEGMGGSLNTAGRIYLNAVHGMDNIVQGVPPQIARGSISSIANKSEGEYKLFGRWWWAERSSYSEVNISNPSPYDTVYQVIADYGNTGFLGMSYQPLVGEGVKPIAGNGSDTVRVPYKRDDEGVSPDEGSTIAMDLLGSTDTGTYHVTRDGTVWNPTRVTTAGMLQAISPAQADAPTIPYPIRTRITVDEDTLTYIPHIWVDNPFTETVVITLTQPLPAGGQVVDPGGGALVGNSLRWQMTLNAETTVEISHTVRYLGDAGQLVHYPQPQLEMTDLGATASVTFTGEVEPFVSQPPLSAAGVPPVEVLRGQIVTIPITVTNRLTDEAASGTVRLSLIDFRAETEVYTDARNVTVPGGGSQTVNLVLDTSGVSVGDYLLMAVVESKGGQKEIFAEYLEVKLRVYLPLILRNR